MTNKNDLSILTKKDMIYLLNNKDKESINIFEQEFNKYQNIFTGYIDNVNYTINFGGLSKREANDESKGQFLQRIRGGSIHVYFDSCYFGL